MRCTSARRCESSADSFRSSPRARPNRSRSRAWDKTSPSARSAELSSSARRCSATVASSPAKLMHQPAFVRPAGDHHLAPQPRELGAHGRRRWTQTGAHGVEQRIALADEAVEIGQGVDRGRVFGWIACDDREPQPKLGEPNGRGIAIHTEEIALQDTAADHRAACSARDDRKPLQRAQQERPGARGRVQQRDPAEKPANFRGALGEPLPGLRLGAAQPAGHEGDEGRVEHRSNQIRRGVVGARRAAVIPGHHPFEDPAEHVRGDGVSIAFGDGEMKPLEQVVERVAPEVVADVGPIPALQGVGLEQAAVEERHRAEA